MKKQHLCIVSSSLQIYRTNKLYNIYPFWLPLLQLSFGLTPALTGPVTTQVAEQKSPMVTVAKGEWSRVKRVSFH